MSPADRIARARALIVEAQGELRMASLILKGSRPELDLEVVALECSRCRLACTRSRVLGMAWRRFVALMDRLGKP